MHGQGWLSMVRNHFGDGLPLLAEYDDVRADRHQLRLAAHLLHCYRLHHLPRAECCAKRDLVRLVRHGECVPFSVPKPDELRHRLRLQLLSTAPDSSRADPDRTRTVDHADRANNHSADRALARISSRRPDAS